jgi:hypothetical protein
MAKEGRIRAAIEGLVEVDFSLSLEMTYQP